MASANMPCSVRADLVAQISKLHEHYSDLISERISAQTSDSMLSVYCRRAEWQAISDHCKGLRRLLADHDDIHGCAPGIQSNAARLQVNLVFSSASCAHAASSTSLQP